MNNKFSNCKAHFRRFCVAAIFLLNANVLPIHAAPDGARVVKYSKEDVVPVRAKLRQPHCPSGRIPWRSIRTR